MQLSGLVLSGGYSSRAGFDKGLFFSEGLIRIKEARDLLLRICDKAYISIRKEQKELYLSHIPAENLVFDEPFGEGPLKGILSTHHQHPDSDFLVLAVDLLDINEEILTNLVDIYSTKPNYTCYVYQNTNQKIEPLCTIYRKEFLQDLFSKIQTLENYSLYSFIQKSHTYYLKLSSENKSYFQKHGRRRLFA